VNKVLTGIGALFVAACGPDFSDNGAIRCEDSVECGPQAACYRGFCVADPRSLGPIEVDPDAGQLSFADDAGQELAIPAADASAASPADASAAPPTQLAVAPSEKPDASTIPDSTPDATVPQSPAQPVATPAPVAPVTTSPTPTTPTPTTPSTGVPEGSKCSLKECCAEAKKAYEDRVEHEKDPKYSPKAGKCGCSGPDLLNTLTCGLGSLTGLT
jgi:hypothetical protein